MSVNKFGASAPAHIVIKNYGFTVENVEKTLKIFIRTIKVM